MKGGRWEFQPAAKQDASAWFLPQLVDACRHDRTMKSRLEKPDQLRNPLRLAVGPRRDKRGDVDLTVDDPGWITISEVIVLRRYVVDSKFSITEVAKRGRGHLHERREVGDICTALDPSTLRSLESMFRNAQALNDLRCPGYHVLDQPSRDMSGVFR